MKPKERMTPRLFASALLCLIVALVLLAGPGAGPASGQMGRFGPVGTWNFKAKFTVPPPGFPPSGEFEGVETFNLDGSMHVVTNLPGVTIGMGSWKSTGFGRFTFTFTFYRQDPSSGYLLAAIVQENGIITNGGANYETTDALMPLGADGKPITNPQCTGPGNACIFPGKVAAQRYLFSDFNKALP